MAAGAGAHCFHLGEIRALVQAGTFVVVPRDGVHSRSVNASSGHDSISYANNGGRIHATAEFGKDGSVGAKSASYCCGEDAPELFFVFNISAIPDPLVRIEIPVPSLTVLPRLKRIDEDGGIASMPM